MLIPVAVSGAVVILCLGNINGYAVNNSTILTPSCHHFIFFRFIHVIYKRNSEILHIYMEMLRITTNLKAIVELL